MDREEGIGSRWKVAYLFGFDWNLFATIPEIERSYTDTYRKNTDTLIRLQSKHEYKNIFCTYILIFYLRIIRLVMRNRKRDESRSRETKRSEMCQLLQSEEAEDCSNMFHICEFA